ncbi:Homeodomain-like domain-containing protein [Streptomyces sp. Ag82_O1-15]|nr:Homeodomain-like domain-containing protein [Streptomyces sp. Ag82_O1-15]
MRFFAEVALDARADRSISSCSQARLSIVANSFGLLMGGRIGLLQRDRLRALMDHLGLRDNAVPAMQHSPFMPGAVRERGLFRRSFAELPRLRRLDVRSNRIARLTDWGVRVPSLEKPDLRWKPCELSPWPLTELDQRELRRPDLSGLPPTHTRGSTRAGAAQRIKDGAIPEQVAAELGVSRSTLYRLRRQGARAALDPGRPRVRMPSMDGIEDTRRIVESGGPSRIPALHYRGNSQDQLNAQNSNLKLPVDSSADEVQPYPIRLVNWFMSK